MPAAIYAAAFASFCDPVPAVHFIDLLLQTGFSPDAYVAHFKDLARLAGDPTGAIGHYFDYGLNERRVSPMSLNRDALTALARLPIAHTDFKAKLLASLADHLFDGMDRPDGDAILDRWAVVRALAAAGARPYFLTGDSHSHQYRLAVNRGPEWLLPIHLPCTGGSARGLANPSSRSGYGEALRHAIRVIETLPGAETLPFLWLFGQIDVEMVYHFHRVRDGRRSLDLDDYRAFCDETIDRYVDFLADLFDKARRDYVNLVSIFPPALSDAAWVHGYVNADILQREMTGSQEDMAEGIRSLQIADLAQRTAIHRYFNLRLKISSESRGFGFIDKFVAFLGTNGVVDPAYLRPDAAGLDHHLYRPRALELTKNFVWMCIDGVDRLAR